MKSPANELNLKPIDDTEAAYQNIAAMFERNPFQAQWAGVPCPRALTMSLYMRSSHVLTPGRDADPF